LSALLIFLPLLHSAWDKSHNTPLRGRICNVQHFEFGVKVVDSSLIRKGWAPYLFQYLEGLGGRSWFAKGHPWYRTCSHRHLPIPTNCTEYYTLLARLGAGRCRFCSTQSLPLRAAQLNTDLPRKKAQKYAFIQSRSLERFVVDYALSRLSNETHVRNRLVR